MYALNLCIDCIVSNIGSHSIKDKDGKLMSNLHQICKQVIIKYEINEKIQNEGFQLLSRIDLLKKIFIQKH